MRFISIILLVLLFQSCEKTKLNKNQNLIDLEFKKCVGEQLYTNLDNLEYEFFQIIKKRYDAKETDLHPILLNFLDENLKNGGQVNLLENSQTTDLVELSNGILNSKNVFDENIQFNYSNSNFFNCLTSNQNAFVSEFGSAYKTIKDLPAKIRAQGFVSILSKEAEINKDVMYKICALEFLAKPILKKEHSQ